MHNLIHTAVEAVSDWWWSLRNGPVEELMLSCGTQDYDLMLNLRRDLMRDHDLPCRVITCDSAQFGDDAEPVDFTTGHLVALIMIHRSGMMTTLTMHYQRDDDPAGG